MDSIAVQFHRLKQDYHFRVLNITLILLFGLILSNQLLLCLLGLPNTLGPGVLSMLYQGFVIPTLISFTVVYMPMSAFALWFSGGIKRAIAQQMLFYWGSFLLLSVLGLSTFYLLGTDESPALSLVYSFIVPPITWKKYRSFNPLFVS